MIVRLSWRRRGSGDGELTDYIFYLFKMPSGLNGVDLLPCQARYATHTHRRGDGKTFSTWPSAPRVTLYMRGVKPRLGQQRFILHDNPGVPSAGFSIEPRVLVPFAVSPATLRATSPSARLFCFSSGCCCWLARVKSSTAKAVFKFSFKVGGSKLYLLDTAHIEQICTRTILGT